MSASALQSSREHSVKVASVSNLSQTVDVTASVKYLAIFINLDCHIYKYTFNMYQSPLLG